MSFTLKVRCGKCLTQDQPLLQIVILFFTSRVHIPSLLLEEKSHFLALKVWGRKCSTPHHPILQNVHVVLHIHLSHTSKAHRAIFRNLMKCRTAPEIVLGMVIHWFKSSQSLQDHLYCTKGPAPKQRLEIQHCWGKAHYLLTLKMLNPTSSNSPNTHLVFTSIWVRSSYTSKAHRAMLYWWSRNLMKCRNRIRDG